MHIRYWLALALFFVGVVAQTTNSFATDVHRSLKEQQAEQKFDIYMESILREARDGQPRHLASYNAKLMKSLNKQERAGLDLLFQYSSPQVMVPPTDHPVNVVNPQCGVGAAMLSDEVRNYQNAISAIGAVVDDYLGTVGFASGVATIVNNAIGKNNTFQKEANCAGVCALVPSEIPVDRLHISTLYQESEGDDFVRRTPDSNSFDDWSQLEKVDYSQIATVKFGKFSHVAPKDDATGVATCKLRLVCSRLKNWSADRRRGAQLIVQVDGRDAPTPPDGAACTDFSVVGNAYKRFKMRAADRDVRDGIYKKYIEKYGLHEDE